LLAPDNINVPPPSLVTVALEPVVMLPETVISPVPPKVILYPVPEIPPLRVNMLEVVSEFILTPVPPRVIAP